MTSTAECTHRPTGIYRAAVIRETDKAVLVGIDRQNTIHVNQANANLGARVSETWLPKSGLKWKATQYGDELWIKPWLARKL